MKMISLGFPKYRVRFHDASSNSPTTGVKESNIDNTVHNTLAMLERSKSATKHIKSGAPVT